MSDVHEQRIFTAEQIDVPDNFPGILKNFIKSVVRGQPENIVEFSRAYFEDLHKNRGSRAGGQYSGDLKPKDRYTTRSDAITDHYDFYELLGEPYVSRTRRGIHRETQENRAIKIVLKADLEQSGSDRMRLLHQIELLTNFDHPNIGQVIEIFEDDRRLYFVCELMYGGSLLESIIRQDALSEYDSASICRQLLAAVAYLHENGLVHGDVKPNNIFFPSDESDAVKLLDVGTSRRIAMDQTLHSIHGSAFFCAPEAILGDMSDPRSDVFSIGVILFILLSGQPPFYGASAKEVTEAILKGDFSFNDPVWQYVSPAAQDLLSQMLTRDVSYRLKAEEAFNHPYFDALDTEQDQFNNAEGQEVIKKNLQDFASGNKMRQSCLGYLIKHFTSSKDKTELERTFKQLDQNGDGFLSKEELREGYKVLFGADFNQKELEELIEIADTNDDGKLSYQEWVAAAVNREQFLSGKQLEGIFAELDQDGNQSISIGELSALLGSSSEIDQDTAQGFMVAFKQADADQSGELSFPQFQKLMQQILQQ